MDESISNLRDVGQQLTLKCNFKGTFYRQTVQIVISDQTPLSIVRSKFKSLFYMQTERYLASDLGLHCLPMPHKKDFMLM